MNAPGRDLEWFCFRSPEMIREYDLFLNVARDRTRFLVRRRLSRRVLAGVSR
jgi:hypothetical protein